MPVATDAIFSDREADGSIKKEKYFFSWRFISLVVTAPLVPVLLPSVASWWLVIFLPAAVITAAWRGGGSVLSLA